MVRSTGTENITHCRPLIHFRLLPGLGAVPHRGPLQTLDLDLELLELKRRLQPCRDVRRVVRGTAELPVPPRPAGGLPPRQDAGLHDVQVYGLSNTAFAV